MFENTKLGPGRPADQESGARLKEAKERVDNWIGDQNEGVTVAIRIPLPLHIALLKEANRQGVPLSQYCVQLLSPPLSSSTK